MRLLGNTRLGELAIWAHPFVFTGEGVKAVEKLAARVLKFEGRDIGKETVEAGNS